MKWYKEEFWMGDFILLCWLIFIVSGFCVIKAEAQEVQVTETPDSASFKLIWNIETDLGTFAKSVKIVRVPFDTCLADTTPPLPPDSVIVDPDEPDIVWGSMTVAYHYLGIGGSWHVWYFELYNETGPLWDIALEGNFDCMVEVPRWAEIEREYEMGECGDDNTLQTARIHFTNGVYYGQTFRVGMNSLIHPTDLKLFISWWDGNVYEYQPFLQSAEVDIQLPERTSDTPNKFSAFVTWHPNSELDLAGYKIYYGTEPGVYHNNIDVGNRTQYEIIGLNVGQDYYFAVTAYDLARNESIYSLEFPLKNEEE